MTRLRLPIASPCHESWNDMTGSERKRHCQICDKNVHHLSQMTAPEARRLLDARRPGERLCVRYACNDDGTVRFRPERVTAPAPRMARFAVAGLATVLAACTPHGKTDPVEVDTHEIVEVMGAAAPVIPDEPEPIHEVMGEMVALDEIDEPCGTEEPAVDPDPEPRPMKMGKIAYRPEPRELMGDVAADPDPVD